MAQRCGLCGKTEKQHKGIGCIDPALQKIVDIAIALKQCKGVPKGTDPLLRCKKCGVWSARKDYCSNCKEVRK